MSIKEMKTLTIGDDIFEICDEKSRAKIEELIADLPKKPEDIGADPVGTASVEVYNHNESDISHSDIRLLISNLTSRINGILDSEDVDLDQLSELVNYIKSNRNLIEQVTTNKVNVSDIIDNLATNVSNKPLSAKQGSVLKGLIDAIKIPSALSELTDDSTHRVVTDTEKQTWNAKSNFSGSYNDLTNKPTIPTTPQQVGAEPSGTAESKVSEHNTSETSHNDIRLLIEGLTTRLNALANSDDTTLDQMAEVVAYIKSNKSLIDAVTTDKVNYSDIIDNITTSVTNKPLSARQGVVLKGLIDAITVPKKISELSDDSNHRTVTDDEKSFWNNKSNFSGSYADLTEKPTIPTKTSQLTNDSGFLTSVPTEYVTETELTGKGYAKQTDVDRLSNEIVDYRDELESDEFKESVAEKVPYVKVAQEPTFVDSIAEMTDTSKMYVLKSDGMFYSYKQRTVTTEGTSTPNFTNVMESSDSYIKDGYRYSHSGQKFSEYAGCCSIVVPVVAGNNVIRVRGAENVGNSYDNNLYWGTTNSVFTQAVSTMTRTVEDNGDIKLSFNYSTKGYVVFCVKNGVTVDDLIITVNEEITYTVIEGGTEVITEWSSTGISYNQPADYENRVISNEKSIAQLQNKTTVLEQRLDNFSFSNTSDTSVFSTPAFAPVPQLPADGSDGSDFNVNDITTQEAYDYMDMLCNKYKQYITKQTMGKDESGNYDYNRYILGMSYWKAWQKENYPKMFAWINGNTVIYSVSVSPRVDDSMYSTPYVGTVYNTVTSVNCVAKTASTRTVNGLVFTRYESGDVEPTIVYTKPTNARGSFAKTSVYDSAFASLTTVSSVGVGSITCADGITYIRYPFEDRKQDKSKPFSIFLLANEHGGDNTGDSLVPSIATMRLAKDLCKNTSNPMLQWLKANAMITMIPVGNPYGYPMKRDGVNNYGYYNANGVNINRNYDTPGWLTSDTNYGDVETFGDYAGSENETQYIMNTMRLCKPKVGISMHGLGFQTDDLANGVPDDTANIVYQGQGFDSSRCHKIGEVMYSAYGVGYGYSCDYSQHYEMCGKSPAYIQYVGAVGGLIEISSLEGCTNQENTAITMEQAYTQILLFLQTWCEEAIEKMS